MEIFKAYDIRGKYGQGIDTDFAYILGRGLARFIGKTRYLIGYDARTYSRALYEALARGLTDEGIDVTGTGCVSTPCLHYMQIAGSFDAGIMVTASHNPPEYHGFKVFDATGGSISLAKGLDKVRDMLPGLENEPVVQNKGTFTENTNINWYIDFLKTNWEARQGKKPLNMKIVIDISNGSAGKVFQTLAQAIKADIILINENPDGSFPNHNPNPLEKESRMQIAKAVKEHNAVAGAILDGDGDRVLFVDEQGEMIQNYFMAALIAEELLGYFPERAIVYDLISSRVLPERISECSGEPVVAKVGYTHIYDKMVESDAIFGAEASGHVYFRVSGDYYTESAAYAVLLVLLLLSRRHTSLSNLVASLKERYFQAEEVNSHVKDKQGAMDRIAEHYKDYIDNRLDGISVDAGDYWFNVRPSNTEPLLRLRLEAKTKEIALEKTKEIQALMEAD